MWLNGCVNLTGDVGGGGVDYLQSDPASRRRSQKGKSQIWESEIWSQVPRDSDPRKTTLARTSILYKRQTGPLVREGAPQNQDCKCRIVINIWSWASDGARHQDLLIDWSSVTMWLDLTGVVQWLRLALSKGTNWVGVSPPHLRMETDPVSETSSFLFSRIPNDGKVQKPSNSDYNVRAYKGHFERYSGLLKLTLLPSLCKKTDTYSAG
jgi:hypothetical protein